MIRESILLAIIFILIFSCSINSQDGKAEYMKIYTVHQSGDNKKAMSMLKDYVKKYPGNYRGWTFYGVVLVEEDQDSIAEIAFNKALKLNPKIPQALTGLGVINRARGDYLEAERLYKKSLEIDPNFSEAYSSLIIIELIRKDYAQAIEFGQKAWNLDNNNGTTAANLSLAYHFKGDFESRDKFFTHAKRLGYGELDILKLIFGGNTTLDVLLENKP